MNNMCLNTRISFLNRDINTCTSPCPTIPNTSCPLVLDKMIPASMTWELLSRRDQPVSLQVSRKGLSLNLDDNKES